MATTADFLGAAYDKLAGLLGASNTSTSVVLQMAWPGYALSPADFKPAAAPTGPYNTEVARETSSRLANIAPVLARPMFDNSGFEVDDLYEILLASAIPAGATANDVATNPLYKLFSDAQYEFLQSQVGSYGDPNLFYHPAVVTPVNWYDEAASPYWSTFTTTSQEVQPATPNSPFVKAGGPAIVNRGVWRVRPTAATAPSIKGAVADAITARSRKVLVGATVTKPLLRQVAAATRVVAGPHATVHTVNTRGASFVSGLNAARAPNLFRQKAQPVNATTTAALRELVQTIDLTKSRYAIPNASAIHRYLIDDLVVRALPLRPSTTTDGFSLSFKFCRVNIDRPWLKLALLNNRNWYMFNTAAGEYSSGSPTDNPGMFPLLPTAFIAIRDLKITANWSQEDRQLIQGASSFGFFDVRDGTLNANTLEVRGLQILAWISKVTPLLPPLAPP